MRAAALILATVLALILCAWGLIRFLGSRSAEPRATAAVSSSSEAPVDLVDVASTALQDCARPVAPALPDGATASREQMTAARTSFQAYDAATNSYAHCVDAAIERVAAQYAAVAAPTELKSLRAFGTGAHDTAIDQEQSFADQLNVQIRAYKARHPQ
jgi:hypothetical protein